jgi:peptidoglycan/xylan/chitin deacetylase (PgdA/CDA1 family)
MDVAKSWPPFLFLLLFLTSTGHSQSPTPSATVEQPKIAFTFDDLPAHSALPPGVTPLEVAKKTVAALHQAKMPPTYGFVNGARVEEQPEDGKVLSAWVDAGNRLGNHTWSHMNLNQNPIKEFETEISRNESLLIQTANGGDWHWFRYPFLAEGETPEKRAEVRRLLAQRGYKIAGVTMGFGDYLWNEPYARCRTKGDSAAIATLESSYLAAAEESIGYFRDLSHKLYGRDIPYVLLMHIGGFDAEMLPRLLDLYRSKGFKFVTLEEAEKDEFYRRETNLSEAPGPNSLEGEMKERQLAAPPRAITNPQFDLLCR